MASVGDCTGASVDCRRHRWLVSHAQELRLHQRGGVDYDKAVIWVKKLWRGCIFEPNPNIGYIESVAQAQHQQQAHSSLMMCKWSIASPLPAVFEALVVAKPAAIDAAGLTVLALPDALSGEVGRV